MAWASEIQEEFKTAPAPKPRNLRLSEGIEVMNALNPSLFPDKPDAIRSHPKFCHCTACLSYFQEEPPTWEAHLRTKSRRNDE